VYLYFSIEKKYQYCYLTRQTENKTEFGPFITK